MIQNERQYAVTRQKLAMLAERLEEVQRNPNPDLPEDIRQGDLSGMRFLMEDLETEIAEYEKLRDGQVSTIWLKSLPYAEF